MLSGIKDSEGLENKLRQTKQVRKIQYQVKLLNCLFWFYGTSAGKLKQNKGLPWWLRRKDPLVTQEMRVQSLNQTSQ